MIDMGGAGALLMVLGGVEVIAVSAGRIRQQGGAPRDRVDAIGQPLRASFECGESLPADMVELLNQMPGGSSHGERQGPI